MFLIFSKCSFFCSKSLFFNILFYSGIYGDIRSFLKTSKGVWKNTFLVKFRHSYILDLQTSKDVLKNTLFHIFFKIFNATALNTCPALFTALYLPQQNINLVPKSPSHSVSNYFLGPSFWVQNWYFWLPQVANQVCLD